MLYLLYHGGRPCRVLVRPRSACTWAEPAAAPFGQLSSIVALPRFMVVLALGLHFVAFVGWPDRDTDRWDANAVANNPRTRASLCGMWRVAHGTWCVKCVVPFVVCSARWEQPFSSSWTNLQCSCVPSDGFVDDSGAQVCGRCA